MSNYYSRKAKGTRYIKKVVKDRVLSDPDGSIPIAEINLEVQSKYGLSEKFVRETLETISAAYGGSLKITENTVKRAFDTEEAE